jgi:hypothetical protein
VLPKGEPVEEIAVYRHPGKSGETALKHVNLRAGA